MRILVFIFVFASLDSAFASKHPNFTTHGQIVGNGGDAIVCPDGTANPGVFLLDYYEGAVHYSFDLKLDRLNGSPTEIVEQLLTTLDINPYRQTKYRQQLQAFYDESLFLAGVRLIDVPDSDHVAVPIGCTVEQVVVQRDPLFPEDHRYTINKDLWDQMTNAHRAGLIFHEIIYRDALTQYHKNSIRSRYLTALLTSRLGEPFFVGEYKALMEVVDFSVDFIFANEFILRSHSIDLTSDGLVDCAYYKWDDDFSPALVIQNQEIDITKGGYVCFFADSRVRHLTTQSSDLEYVLDVGTYGPRVVRLPLTFAENGTVSSARFAEKYSWTTFNSCQVTNEIDDEISVYDTGIVRSMVVVRNRRPEQFCHPGLGAGLTKISAPPFGRVTFHPNGAVAEIGNFVEPISFVFDRGIEVEVLETWQFYETGIPSTGTLMHDSSLYDPYGVKHSLSAGGRYSFDAEGRVIEL